MMRYDSLGEVIEYEFGIPIWSTSTIERTYSKSSFKKVKKGLRILAHKRGKMKNEWISLIERLEKVLKDNYISINLFSDGSGSIDNGDGKELYMFENKENIILIIEELEK